jgi:exonuclease SbcC
LREGEPCPVCGSSKHPALAKAPEGDVSDAKLKELLSVSDEAKQKADQQSTECASLITTIKLLFDQFNTAATVYFQTNTDENIGDLITSKLLKAKAYSQELFEKKSRDEISLANLTCETENAAKRKTELEPEYNALQVEVTTLKVKFMKDITVFLSIALWENVGTLLFELLTNTQTSVEDLKAKRSADDKALTELKEKWENATKSQKDLKTTSTALHSSISTLVRSFLTDFSEYIPDVIWDSAGEKLSVLLDETTAQFSDVTEKKNVDEVILAELKAHWETAKSDRINYNTELEKKKSSKDEREKHEKNCFKKYEETQKLFISALSNNGFENEKDYSASLISEEELSDISKQITDFEENGKQIKIEIKRLKKETENKEKPDLDKLKFDLNEIKNASEALRIDRDEINLQLDNKKRILKELTKSAEDLVKIERAYATIKSLSDTANGKLDFETYAQMTYFERVLRAANQRLKVMSQNRYVLLRKNENDDGRKRMGLEIEVADSYTGKSRSANTLSGGESFMASLSLALGLSDVVQQSTGGIRLDAMFIDEGFGSLDADVLELSIRTLSDMADGNRIIGIISHVAELRERIDKQVYVE